MKQNRIGSILREKRKERNLTQKQLGGLLHVDATTISKWETGTNTPDLNTLIDISKILDLTILEVLAEYTAPKTEISNTAQ